LIIELGFVVCKENVERAVFKIKYWLKKILKIKSKRESHSNQGVRVCHMKYNIGYSSIRGECNVARKPIIETYSETKPPSNKPYYSQIKHEEVGDTINQKIKPYTKEGSILIARRLLGFLKLFIIPTKLIGETHIIRVLSNTLNSKAYIQNYTYYYIGDKDMKTRVNLVIEKEIMEKAKNLGLNVSKTVENLLGNYIKQHKAN